MVNRINKLYILYVYVTTDCFYICICQYLVSFWWSQYGLIGVKDGG